MKPSEIPPSKDHLPSFEVAKPFRLGTVWAELRRDSLCLEVRQGRYYVRDLYGFIGSVATLEELDLLFEAENTPPPVEPGKVRRGARDLCFPGWSETLQAEADHFRSLRPPKQEKEPAPGKKKFDPSLVRWDSDSL
jgi:hypothetical protein